MALRCFVFSSDEGTAAILRQILSDLGVEAEFCPDAVGAVERITNQLFQIVVIDWDQQPEAGLLLNTAGQRKASERPLTLAIVSNDPDAPKALHAGANSLLRKPIVANHARDTLATARDLLGAKHGSGTSAAPRPAAPSVPVFPVIADQPGASALRAGEFLQGPAVSPGEQIETEAAIAQSTEAAYVEPSLLKELEPTAAALSEEKIPQPKPEEPANARGLQWYLQNRVAPLRSQDAAAAPAPAPVPVIPVAPAPRAKPELLSYDQITPSPTGPVTSAEPTDNLSPAKPARTADVSLSEQKREQKKEAELFAYIQGEKDASSDQPASAGSRFARRALVPAMILAALAVIATPQAPWHPRLQGLLRSGKQALHAWLNPQPATPTQAPAAHETFIKPGDEYKLPVTEPIPDATTDPSQIEVVPVTDPTIKERNPEGNNAVDPSAAPTEGSPSPAGAHDQTTAPSGDAQPASHAAPPSQPPVVTVIESPAPGHSAPVTPPSSALFTPATSKLAQPRATTAFGSIPPSLKSQLAPANPPTGGNKPVDSVPLAIEPVDVPEAAERTLITENPSPAYPANAKGQQGTVLLQVLIGRDGTVQDAKFMQGSLLFARNAIDAVKQWKFKPYSLNGHPVSVQTQLTIKLKPTQ